MESVCVLRSSRCWAILWAIPTPRLRVPLCSGWVSPPTVFLAIFPAISHPLARPHCQTHLSITPTTSNNAGEEEGENSVAGAAVGVGFSTSQAAPTRFSISFALVLPSIFHPPSLAVRRHFYARRMQQATRTTSRRLLCVCVCAGEKVGGPILASISWTTQ